VNVNGILAVEIHPNLAGITNALPVRHI